MMIRNIGIKQRRKMKREVLFRSGWNTHRCDYKASRVTIAPAPAER